MSYRATKSETLGERLDFIRHSEEKKCRIGVGLKRSKRDQPFIRVTLHVRVHGLIFCLHKQDS